MAKMTAATTTENQNHEIDQLAASERHRLSTFERWGDLPISTRRSLALAGFLLEEGIPTCLQCGITIELSEIDKDEEYKENHFRAIHREKISVLGKRCGFLLCENGSNIDDLRDAISSRNTMSLDEAEHPDYREYQMRLSSFDRWPSFEHFQKRKNPPAITAKAMATHGFFFSGPTDGVTCFYCGNTLINWLSCRDPDNEYVVQLEHARFFPCRFINYTAGGKFVANAGFLHPVSDLERKERNPMTWKTTLSDANIEEAKPRNVEECLDTFAGWPLSAPITSRELANVGFYWLGEALKVKCFVCDVEVSEWMSGMTALGTHRRRSPNCRIVHAMQNSNSAHLQAMNEKWRLETLSGLTFGENGSTDDENDQHLAEELAACGFFRMKRNRIIRCAFCGVTIQPKQNESIMSQHRQLAKRSLPKQLFLIEGQQQDVHIDCPMVRANCPANMPISGRRRFPEHPNFQNVFDRIKSFESYKDKRPMTKESIKEMADAGFFFFDHNRGTRCFQCGNFFPIRQKKTREKFGKNEIIRIHAHLYPTCEWVHENLGPKYVAQVLHDRYKSNQSQDFTLSGFNRQLSSMMSHMSTDAPISLMSSSSTSSITSMVQTPGNEKVEDEYDSDRHHDTSSDEEFQAVATPATASIPKIYNPIRSLSVPHPTLDPSATLPSAETCRDQIPLATPASSGSPFSPSRIALYQQQKSVTSKVDDDPNFEQSVTECQTPDTPLSIPSPSENLAPVDLFKIYSHESNRLETFQGLKDRKFANIDAAHLAYVGFYLCSSDDAVRCPWCEVRLKENEFLEIIETRPSVPIQTLMEQEWTPMRVHRHANGLIIDDKHPYCSWVRRQPIGLYPNVVLQTSFLKFPEYPYYANYAIRVKSFTIEWAYSTGSRLSRENMAHAGFFHIGDDSVCCFYCGNKLQKFEPKDCPFEEHATFYPYCDFIQHTYGMENIQRVILENGDTPQGRFKYETESGQIIKRIVFPKSGTNRKKLERPPAQLKTHHMLTPVSPLSNRILTTPTTDNELVDDTCIVCLDQPYVFEYEFCHHRATCRDCSIKIEQQHREACMVCRRPGKLIQRSSITAPSQ